MLEGMNSESLKNGGKNLLSGVNNKIGDAEFAITKAIQGGTVKLFSYLGLGYFVMTQFIASGPMKEFFLFATWTTIFVFYLMIGLIAGVMWLVMDSLIRLLLYVFK